jgi:hypothetical protein
MILGHAAVLENNLAVVHKRPPMVSARVTVRPGASRGTRKLEVPWAYPRRWWHRQHKARVVAVADKFLRRDHPFVPVQHALRLHCRLGHVVGQPAVRRAARFREAVR